MATKNGIEKPPALKVLAEIKTIVGLAKKGDVTVLPRLRQLLTQHPDLWKRYGDLAAQAEMAWANLAAGTDLHLRESLLRQAEALRAELGGPTPSPVMRLLVERAVACWLQLHYFDAVEAQTLANDEKSRLAAYRAKRQEQAQRMYFSALAALTTLRRLLPAKTGEPTSSTKSKPSTVSECNEQHHNDHTQALPPISPNRLAAFFDKPKTSRKAGRRKEKLFAFGFDG